MRYLSVCSGIEAASVAWAPLGWEPAVYSEIDPFPRAVLKHRHPSVPLHGDFTTIQGNQYGSVRLLVGGTPCQSFSVAGLRKGMADPRGNLALGFLGLAERLHAEWVVWENVPGVLSSNGGRDFGAFLGGLAELGYGFAYRVLDAQYIRVDGFGRAVPQRRRRVFVVGHLGDWRRAAAVLFECESMSGNPAPRRKAGEGTPRNLADRVAGSLCANMGQGNQFAASGQFDELPGKESSLRSGVEQSARIYSTEGVSPTLDHSDAVKNLHRIPVLDDQGGSVINVSYDVSPCLRRETHGHLPSIPLAFAHQQSGSVDLHTGNDVALTCQRHQQQAVAYAFKPKYYLRDNPKMEGAPRETTPTLCTASDVADSDIRGMAVRRITPREAERLQGFPDDYTLVPYRGKPAADGPRYKALGNSMAVNVMRWLGTRIQMVEDAVGAAEVRKAA